MPEKEAFKVESAHLTIELDEDLLKIDVRGSLKNDIEEALENKTGLKETIGAIMDLFVPLHIHLSDIDSAVIDEKRTIRIKLPHHRDVSIPLKRDDAERLLDRLNQLIPKAKNRKLKERITRRRAGKLKKMPRGTPPSSYTTMPYYFPTEQVDIVNKLRRKNTKRRRKDKLEKP